MLKTNNEKKKNDKFVLSRNASSLDGNNILTTTRWIPQYTSNANRRDVGSDFIVTNFPPALTATRSSNFLENVEHQTKPNFDSGVGRAGSSHSSSCQGRFSAKKERKRGRARGRERGFAINC